MIDILETTKDLHMVFAQIPSHTFLKVYTKTSLKTVLLTINLSIDLVMFGDKNQQDIAEILSVPIKSYADHWNFVH